MIIGSFKWKQLRQVIQLAEFIGLDIKLTVEKATLKLGFTLIVEEIDHIDCDWIKHIFIDAEDCGFMPYS